MVLVQTLCKKYVKMCHGPTEIPLNVQSDPDPNWIFALSIKNHTCHDI